jgi:hypothetical protein
LKEGIEKSEQREGKVTKMIKKEEMTSNLQNQKKEKKN